MKKIFLKLILVITFVTSSALLNAQSGYVSNTDPVYKTFFYTGKLASFNAAVAYFYPASNPCSMCVYTDSLSPSFLDGGVIFPNFYLVMRNGVIDQWSLSDSSVFKSLFRNDTSKWYVDKSLYYTAVQSDSRYIQSSSSVTPGTYEFVTVNNKGIITAAYNSVTNDISARTSGTAYQASSTTRTYDLDFTVTITSSSTLLNNADGQVVLEISANGSTGWVEYTRSQTTISGVLANTSGTQQLIAFNIPAGYYYKLTFTKNSSAAGSSGWSYLKGHETLRR